MQTFVPYRDFTWCASVLDTKRLGKQRVEVIQIVRALTVPGYAWANHPAVLMWQGYEEALGRYGLVCCDAWLARGFDDTCAGTIAADLAAAGIPRLRTQGELQRAGALPGWLDDPALRRSHRSALLRKDRAHYAAVFPGVPDDLDYVWPVRSAAVIEKEERQRVAAVKRAERAAQKKLDELLRAKQRRSDAARRAARTRAANKAAAQRTTP